VHAAKAASLSLQFTTELGALQGILVGTFWLLTVSVLLESADLLLSRLISARIQEILNFCMRGAEILSTFYCCVHLLTNTYIYVRVA
jgi:hypothetical protein